jgi:DNA-binding protein HU-beta
MASKATNLQASHSVTLKHLAANLAKDHHLTKRTGEALLGDLVGLITKHLKRGERVRIAGLGILQVRKRAARTGRNPATGEPMQIKASKKVAFRATKGLKLAACYRNRRLPRQSPLAGHFLSARRHLGGKRTWVERARNADDPGLWPMNPASRTPICHPEIAAGPQRRDWHIATEDRGVTRVRFRASCRGTKTCRAHLDVERRLLARSCGRFK